MYSGVKSKVAGNMKSIKKAQTRTMNVRGDATGNSGEATRSRAKTYTSPKKAQKGAQPSTYSDNIISEIKNKYSKEEINEMTQEQLAGEIL